LIKGLPLLGHAALMVCVPRDGRTTPGSQTIIAVRLVYLLVDASYAGFFRPPLTLPVLP
jgi:hypothetical protein